ncbi:hypothetical protein C8F04DRAFT_1239597 [Mycena alexandri]|uniref:Uncharacterized protein n=1 Tax=Mycena alexandri TaxID=1745969 RepID=A0AAD6WX80_9AGAR|nr:hypothetical protein C8F04DRAFT_1239597 [Mycena alexandri]
MRRIVHFWFFRVPRLPAPLVFFEYWERLCMPAHASSPRTSLRVLPRMNPVAREDSATCLRVYSLNWTDSRTNEGHPIPMDKADRIFSALPSPRALPALALSPFPHLSPPFIPAQSFWSDEPAADLSTRSARRHARWHDGPRVAREDGGWYADVQTPSDVEGGKESAARGSTSAEGEGVFFFHRLLFPASRVDGTRGRHGRPARATSPGKRGWTESALKRGAATEAAGGAERLAAWQEWILAAWTQGGGCGGADRGAGTSEAAGSGSERGRRRAGGLVVERVLTSAGGGGRGSWERRGVGSGGRWRRQKGASKGGVGSSREVGGRIRKEVVPGGSDVFSDGGVDVSALFGGIHAECGAGWGAGGELGGVAIISYPRPSSPGKNREMEAGVNKLELECASPGSRARVCTGGCLEGAKREKGGDIVASKHASTTTCEGSRARRESTRGAVFKASSMRAEGAAPGAACESRYAARRVSVCRWGGEGLASARRKQRRRGKRCEEMSSARKSTPPSAQRELEERD